jgi:hypothetical protein
MIRLVHDLRTIVSLLSVCGLWFCLVAGRLGRAHRSGNYADRLPTKRSSRKFDYQPLDIARIWYFGSRSAGLARPYSPLACK